MRQEIVKEAFASLIEAYEALCRSQGVAPLDLLANVGVSRAALAGGGYLSWDEFRAFLENLDAALGSPADLEELGDLCLHWTTKTQPLKPFRRLLRSFTSPRRAYRALWTWVGPRMFRPIQPSYQVLGPGRIRLGLALPAEYPPSAFYFKWAVLSTSYTMSVMDLPRAKLHNVKLSDRGCDFELELPKSATLLARSLGWFRRIRAGRALEEAVLEAREQTLEAEEAVSEIWNKSIEGFALLSGGRIVRANPTLSRAARPNGELPETWAELFLEDDRAAAGDLVAGCLEEAVLRCAGADGIVWLDCRRGGDLRFRGAPALLIVARDITGTKSLEEKLRARHRLSALGQLSASLGHEIATPLAVVHSNLQLLHDSIGKNDRLDAAIRNVEHLAKVTSGLLNLAREQRFPPTKVDVTRGIQQAIEVARPLAKKAGVELRFVGAGTIERACREHEIVQAVVHLLTNAVDASSAAGQRIVEVELADRAEVITVKDRGAGLPPELTKDLVKPFFTTKASGTGLGLSTAVRLLRANGGDLRYRRGTDFTEFVISLPR